MMKAFAYLALVFTFLFILAFIYIVSQASAVIVNGMQYAYNQFVLNTNGTNGITYSVRNMSAYTGLNTTTWQGNIYIPVNQFINYLPIMLIIMLIAALIWTFRRT